MKKGECIDILQLKTDLVLSALILKKDEKMRAAIEQKTEKHIEITKTRLFGAIAARKKKVAKIEATNHIIKTKKEKQAS